MESIVTLGQVRDLLSGLRCPDLAKVEGPEDALVQVSTAFHRGIYGLVIEPVMIGLAPKRKKGRKLR
jgi:hypothetical protein